MAEQLTYVCGTSEATEAEYGVRFDAPFTMVELLDGQVIGWLPYETFAEMRADAKRGKEIDNAIIEWL